MVRLRSRYFSCFYCGRRSTVRSDSRLREFTCTNCDATNHLDENGEITDPPVVEVASPKQYAVPSRATSPTDLAPSSSFTSFSENIFCDTCLKNQRLFTASLAQYLPDDPSHPDYADLERRYYRFRKDLEKRYPQVCADCAGKVESRIKQAGYTAKTDHLRLMMERSRTRNVRKRTTPLDLADSAGRWLWWAGLVLQTLWHLANVARALQQQQQQQQQKQQHGQGMYDPDEKTPMSVAMVAHLYRGVALLPDTHALIRWSISAGLLSVWWNPHFVQLSRGFTRHLVGFAQWYLFQGLIVVLRYLFRNIVSMRGGQAQSRHAQLSVHLAMASVMCFIYYLANRSIKVDTSPLFGPPGRAVTAPPLGQITPARKTKDEPKTLAEELTDALDATIPARIPPTPRQEPPPPPPWRGQTPLLAPPVPSTPYTTSSTTSSRRGASPFSMRNLDVPGLSPIKSDRRPHDPDAMDWSPIPAVRSAHRALQTPTSATGSPRPFGQSPVQPDAKPFWFKVPPAPVNPAHRLRNPPNAPLLRQKQEPAAAQDKPGVQFHSRRTAEPRMDQDPAAAAQRNRIDFQQPSFFAPERSDETNFLADAFGSGFSLGVEPVDEGEETEVEERVFAAFPESRPKQAPGGKSGGSTGTSTSSSSQKTDLAGLWTLAALLPSWLLMSFVPVPFRRELQLVSLALAGVTALQGAGQEQAAASSSSSSSSSSSELVGHALNALGVAELGAVCWAWWQVWSVDEPRDVPWLGAAALGCMLGRQAWAFYRQ